jgi:hypothetical protein
MKTIKMVRCRALHRVVAVALTAVAALLVPSMAGAGTTWNTACDTGHGGIRGWNFGSATPRGGQCREDRGQTITSFRVEVPGTQFGKRRRTLTAPGERALIEFPLGSQDPIFQIYMVLEHDPLDTWCYLRVDYSGADGVERRPGHLEETFDLLQIGASTPHGFFTSGDPVATAPELRQYIDSIVGYNLRTEDLFIQIFSWDRSCYAAGIFRYADDPRKFYER